MFYVVFGLLFVAFAGLLIITALRIEANSRVLQENTRVLQRFAPPDSSEERKAIVPPNPIENAATIPRDLPDAEMQAIPRRPQSDTLISGSEAPPPRDTTPDASMALESVDAPKATDLLDDDGEQPTTVLPRCGKCGSVDYAPTGGLFQCKSCGKVGYLRFPGLHRKVA